METSVLIATAFFSLVVPVLKPRGRAFLELFLHLLLTLTVGSLAMRTLSGGGTLVIPFMESWSLSPFMYLTSLRVYGMLAVSLTALVTVLTVDRRVIWMLPVGHIDTQSFLGTSVGSLVGLWFHLTAVVFLALA